MPTWTLDDLQRLCGRLDGQLVDSGRRLRVNAPTGRVFPVDDRGRHALYSRRLWTVDDRTGAIEDLMRQLRAVRRTVPCVEPGCWTCRQAGRVIPFRRQEED